ncbi:hypothetical protein ALC56_01701 [Trachymyrmex septentrionalis]|uniref:DDE Tnp4 domain-containing protein n=1 Tax=Trachymyrmex septentrionalis TaxID=34720 RepID=A0A195FU62_9HYME|nr:hypothetical protein ALC56_01701 [Trachymyrmex septentrionalis]
MESEKQHFWHILLFYYRKGKNAVQARKNYAVPHSGYTFYNYKSTHSIGLLPVADANCCFTIVDIGAEGRRSDDGIFQESRLGHRLENNDLDLPESESIVENGPKLPYVTVCDEAFTLTSYITNRVTFGFCMPHHTVIKASSNTTKVRVVFDASAKTENSNSLNDILRNRMYQRILWRQNNEVKTFELNRLTFGMFSSPYLAPDYSKVQIHDFYNANVEYGACLYIHTKDAYDNIRCLLLCAKCYAILYILGYKYSASSYVSHRVVQIQELTNSTVWRHVNSKDNSADVLSRGQLPSVFLNNRIWFTGPLWLVGDKNEWPYGVIKLRETLELKKNTCLTTDTNDCYILLRYSSYTKMLRCKESLASLRKRDKRDGNTGSKLVQASYVSHELNELANERSVKKTIAALNPFIDTNGLIRFGGRFKNSKLTFMSTVHLEIISDLITEGFLAALQRFIAKRGIPTHVYSDIIVFILVISHNYDSYISLHLVLCQSLNVSKCSQ